MSICKVEVVDRITSTESDISRRYVFTYQWVAVLFFIWPAGPLAEEMIRKGLNCRISAAFEYSISPIYWGTPYSSIHASII